VRRHLDRVVAAPAPADGFDRRPSQRACQASRSGSAATTESSWRPLRAAPWSGARAGPLTDRRTGERRTGSGGPDAVDRRRPEPRGIDGRVRAGALTCGRAAPASWPRTRPRSGAPGRGAPRAR
jgi:hypothetical protein